MFKELKLMKDAINEELQNRLRSNKRWCCWNAAVFGRCTEWFTQAITKPKFYKEDAPKDFANLALGHFEELYNLDKDSALMIFDTFSYDIAKMLMVLGDEGKRFHYMFIITPRNRV